MSLYVLADDLTGANDTAVQFASAGLRTATLLSADPAPWREEYEVLAVTTESRAVSAREAAFRCREALVQLAPGPEELVYKKVDSALRGNVGAEIEGVLEALGPGAVAVLAPAFPANGRTTVNGRQLIGGVPVEQTEMGSDPGAPVRESRLLALLASQSPLPAAHLPLRDVERGPSYLRRRIEELRGSARVIVADATEDEHLLAIAGALLAVEGAVPCGSAGLGAAVAQMLGMLKGPGSDRRGMAPGEREARLARQGRPAGAARLRRPLFAVIGSKSAAARAQVETARNLLPQAAWVAVAAQEFSQRAEEVWEEAAGAAVRALRSGKDAVLYVEPGEEGDPKAIAAGLGAIAQRALDAARPGALYLTGGETAMAVLERLRAAAIEVLSEAGPGICRGRVRGGTGDGLDAITKAGSFGEPRTLYRVMAEG